ncbi:MAG: HYR domain-containing protein, partial [Psychrosphaera sp.]|nr:HYR domain-containing protein [Psychrosphaera sp.]
MPESDTIELDIALKPIVVDQPPVLVVPTEIEIMVNINQGLADSHSDIVTFLSSAIVTDDVDSDLLITNNAPDVFPVGLTTVTFTVTDSAGHTVTDSSTVTIRFVDIDAPVVIAPTDISLTRNDKNGVLATQAEIVAFLAGATVTDNHDTSLSISNNAPVTLPVGITTVVFSATDSAGNIGTASATVTVNFVDADNPVVAAPTDITLTRNDKDGVLVTHDDIVTFLAGATVTDNHDTSLNVTNNAPATFTVGTTTVIFSATDSASNTGTASATVTVNYVAIPQIDPAYTQNLVISDTDISVALNGTFTVSVGYDTSDSNANTSELGFRLHFSSIYLAWLSFSDVLPTSLMGQSQTVQADDNDWDDNPATDRYVEIAWADVNQQVSWPGVLPVTLFNIQFNLIGAITNENYTEIAFSAIQTGITQNETADDVLYALNAPTIKVREGASFNLDIDGNAKAEPFTDGMLVVRYLFGSRGDALIAGVIASDATRTTAAEIEAIIQGGIDNKTLDIDGDGVVEPFTDGFLVIRYLFGSRGAVLIHHAVSGT